MTIDVFINRIDGLLDYVKSGSFTRDIMVYGSIDMVAEIKSRVRETGILGSGKSHPYKDGSYKKKRAEKGMMTDKKNYSFTVEMWNGFGIKDSKPMLVELGGRTEMSQNKINWNTSRDNDVITAPTEKEQQRLTDYINKKLAEVMRNRLTK
jgi:hypothetical protein